MTDTTHEAPELLPCPFCGNAFPAVGYDSDMKALDRENCITARCRQCGSETRKFSNRQDAVEAWNTRSDDLVQAAVAVREAQKAYFKDRSRDNLIASKQAEAALDKMLVAIRKGRE